VFFTPGGADLSQSLKVSLVRNLSVGLGGFSSILISEALLLGFFSEVGNLDPKHVFVRRALTWHRILQENQKYSPTLPRTILFVLNRIGGII
jgi:hypothetical protein